MKQRTFIEQICRDNPEAVIVGSIGTISYDLNEIDHKEKVLVKGAMGHAIGIGFGYALGAIDKKKVIVLIGDGSYLMMAGSASTVLANRLPNLRVIVLHNGEYRSCGGQTTNFEALREYVPFEVINVI